MNRWMHRCKPWLALGALMSILAGCGYVNAEQQAKPELLKPVKRQEDVYEVKSGSIVKQIRGLGVFVPASTKYYQYPVTGRIAAVYVKQGDAVQKGDVLIELSSADTPMKLAQQKLVLAKAEDALEEAKKTRDAERLRLAGLSRQVEQLKLDNLLLSLERTKLVADRSGVVTFLDFMKPGDSMASYKDVVGISDPNALLFQYSVAPGGDLSAVELGMKAEIELNGKTYVGKVIQTPRTSQYTENIVQMEKASRSIVMELESRPPEAVFGTQAEMSIVTDKKDRVLIIPRVALRSYQGRYFVHVKDGDSRKEVDVERGLETATEVEIRKGLKEGQIIILNN